VFSIDDVDSACTASGLHVERRDTNGGVTFFLQKNADSGYKQCSQAHKNARKGSCGCLCAGDDDRSELLTCPFYGCPLFHETCWMPITLHELNRSLLRKGMMGCMLEFRLRVR